MFCIAAQHINIIAKEYILVNHFCNNFDLICPNHWASSLLWVWMVCTPLSNIRAMPEKPTALTTKPKMNPIMSLLMLFPYANLNLTPMAFGLALITGSLGTTYTVIPGAALVEEAVCCQT